jgi:hypothetical protein
MAAAVAHHHASLWHRRTEPSFHISDIHFTGMMPSYNTQRTVNGNTSLRGFPPSTAHMDISLPLFTSNVLATSVPYQSAGSFAYDASVNPYNMQQSSMSQSYPMNYPASMSPPISYAGSAESQSLPAVRDARSAYALDGTHVVKSESTSPVQSNPMFNNTAYAMDCKRSTSEPVEISSINFATDVDTLMKAIQAKHTASSQRPEPLKVSHCYNELPCIFSTDTKRSRSQRPLQSRGSVTSAICRTVTRAFIRRHTWRSTSELTPVQSLS